MIVPFGAVSIGVDVLTLLCFQGPLGVGDVRQVLLYAGAVACNTEDDAGATMGLLVSSSSSSSSTVSTANRFCMFTIGVGDGSGAGVSLAVGDSDM